MTDPLDPLVSDLVAWVGKRRRYTEVMDAWKTSCPRLPVWEEATSRGLLVCGRDPDGVEWVWPTGKGEELVREREGRRTEHGNQA